MSPAVDPAEGPGPEQGSAPGSPVAGLGRLLAAKVLLVTGKGGVGKTTVAAALGLLGAASGRRTLLVEVEGRDQLSRALGSSPWDYREREIRPGLLGAAVDPGDAVREYLELFYGLRGVNWLMERSHALDFVTTAAPGLRDLLLIGKVYELEARRRDDGRRAFDLIVVDAPPTGRIVPFLQAPEAVTDIVRVGPVRRQAGQIAEMLHDPRRARTVVVSLLEETPVRETVEALSALDGAGIAAGAVIANRVATPALSAALVERLEALGPEGLRERAAVHGARLTGPTADLAVRLAAEHHARRRAQGLLLDQLEAGATAAVLALPLRTAPAFDVADLEALADLLAVQVGEDPPHDRVDPDALPALGLRPGADG